MLWGHKKRAKHRGNPYNAIIKGNDDNYNTKADTKRILSGTSHPYYALSEPNSKSVSGQDKHRGLDPDFQASMKAYFDKYFNADHIQKRDEVMQVLKSEDARAAASRALAVVGNDDTHITIHTSNFGAIEIAAAVMTLMWHTSVGIKYLGSKDPIRMQNESRKFPKGLHVHELIISHERYYETPVSSILAAVYAIYKSLYMMEKLPVTPEMCDQLEGELLEFRRARVVHRESRNLLLSLRHHLLSLILTPISTIMHPLRFVWTQHTLFFSQKYQFIGPLGKCLCSILILPVVIIAIVYLYSLGPLLSIMYYIGLIEQRRNEKGWAFWNIGALFSQKTDVTRVEAFGPIAILYGANWLIFTYPNLRRRYFLENSNHICLGDNIIDRERARDFLVEVRAAVMQFTLNSKNFDLVEEGKGSSVVKQSLEDTLIAFERQCSASYVRLNAWCRGRLCLEHPYKLSYSYRKSSSLLLESLSSSPFLLLISAATLASLALLPMSVRLLYGRNPYGGNSFEDRWISLTYILTTFINGFWPMLLTSVWFRKFAFNIFKFSAFRAIVGCSDSEVYGLGFYADLESPQNIAALMILRERLFSLAVKELGYLPPESLLTFLISIPSILMICVLTDLLHGENFIDFELFGVQFRISEPVSVTVSVSLCIFALMYVIVTLMNAAEANYQINNGMIETLESYQNYRTRDRYLTGADVKYVAQLRDTLNSRTTLLIDLAMQSIKSDREFVFTIYGFKISQLTMYSVGSSLGLLILSSLVGSIGRAIGTEVAQGGSASSQVQTPSRRMH